MVTGNMATVQIVMQIHKNPLEYLSLAACPQGLKKYKKQLINLVKKLS